MSQTHRSTCLVLLPVLCLLLSASLQGQPPSPQGQGQAASAPKPPSPQGQGQAAPAAPAGQQPTFRSGVNFVRVDVIATDKDGQPVTDLKQSDLEVSEDGKPQTIETFRFVQVSGQPEPGEVPKAIRSDYDEESEAARDDVRMFAIFLDDYHVRRGAAMTVRQTLVDFIQKQVGAMDMVGLMYPLQPVASVRMTRNHDAIISALQQFEGRKYDYRPRNAIEEKYAYYPASVVERIRNETALSAIESLAIHLGSLREGRKAIILVSEGYTNLLPAQLQDPISSMPGLGNTSRGSLSSGIDDRSAFLANADMLTQLREVYNTANRNNTTIYALDPRGLGVFEFDIGEGVNLGSDRLQLDSTLDTLRVLADQTDGRAIINRNDLDVGLKQVIRDSSAYYLVGYSSTRMAADGRFHEIKVRVKRPDVQIRARKGYWALTAEAAARSLEPSKPAAPPAVTKALDSISEPRRARYIRSWIGTARGEGGKTRVTFVWEALPPVPGGERAQLSGVSLTATGPGDRSYFQGAVEPPPVAPEPAPDAATAGTPAPLRRGPAAVSFDAVPGSLNLRIAVKGTGDETLDTDVREYKIPDLTAPQVAISTPAVFRSANAREFRALGAHPNPVPTASREFRRTERLLVRFEVYGPGDSKPAVTARVLNRGGTPMTELPVRAPDGAVPFYQLDLPLAGFASGEYLIEIKAKGTEVETSELVPLKVTA